MALIEKSRAILQTIAKGHTYEQILVQDLAWTYHDIFQAAAEALETPQLTNEGKSHDVEEIRHDPPPRLREVERWGRRATFRTLSKREKRQRNRNGSAQTGRRYTQPDGKIESCCTALRCLTEFAEHFYAS